MMDIKKLDTYAAEAQARWGHTDAWRESREKSLGKSPEVQAAEADGLMDIFRRLGALRGGDPAAEAAQSLIAELRQYICDHYYNCTPQILRGLGQMYVAGGDMTENIDRAGGEGTAQFARDVIGVYCR